MAAAEGNLSHHLLKLQQTLKPTGTVVITLLGEDETQEKGSLAVVGQDFLELSRAGMVN